MDEFDTLLEQFDGDYAALARFLYRGSLGDIRGFRGRLVEQFAGAALIVGALRPAPWLLALWLVLILFVVWVFGVYRWLQLDDPDEVFPK